MKDIGDRIVIGVLLVISAVVVYGCVVVAWWGITGQIVIL